MVDALSELREEYEGFLRQEDSNYVDRIATAVDDYVRRGRSLGAEAWGCPRVEISMAELRSQDNGRLSQRLRMDPFRHSRALELACHEVATEERPGYDKDGCKIKVAVSGLVGAAPSSPRDLTSAYLRQLVCVEGVATKISSIKPKVVRSVHFSHSSKQHSSKDYVDATDPALGLNAIDNTGRELPDRVVGITSSVYPTKDTEGNPLVTEFGLSVFKDHQTITLQEMPERAPMGQLPRSVELILDHDLVDKVKPGDRVQVVGVYRALATSASGQSTSSGVFKTVVIANHIKHLGRASSQLSFSPQDIRVIKDLSTRHDILDVLGRSICPSIHGHDMIKKALALQLLGGAEKVLENGTHLRGDINILMVGDPSTAKSQLLRSAMMIAPLAVSTTGKGSSGVGLTAAVTSDPDTRERRLEAGAMVLADRGLVCVDEFDKMGEDDRVAIHEAMEQQTVTIAKAGLHASLNARCSVLAAANPVFGQYNRNRRIQENIGLPDSLLSRFDLLFVVLDHMDPETDRKIACHVIQGHRYRPEHGAAGHDSDFDGDDSDDEDDFEEQMGRVNTVWQRSRQAVDTLDEDDPHSSDVLQHDILRKYFHFAKNRVSPQLTEEAHEFIANRYAEMRCRQDERTLPVTVRSLETIIRLATGHAKARLSPTVMVSPDCEAAMEVLSFALYHDNANPGSNTSVPKPAISDDGRKVDSPMVSDGEPDDSQEPPAKRLRPSTGEEVDDPLQGLKERIWNEVDANEGSIALDEACSDATDREAIRQAVEELEREGRIMQADGYIYQVE